MTNSLSSSTSLPAYSGITINITNPTLNPLINAKEKQACCLQECNCSQASMCASQPISSNVITNTVEKSSNVIPDRYQEGFSEQTLDIIPERHDLVKASLGQDFDKTSPYLQSYPASYYMNNYNIQPVSPISQDENKTTDLVSSPVNGDNIEVEPQDKDNNFNNQSLNALDKDSEMNVSNKIIENIDAKMQEENQLMKDSKKTKIVALTNEYIMTLENYLNNPNKEMRVLAAKEILTRLDEDRNRFNDAALNALLNKMLQDPEYLIRSAAMSAFSSQLASGNDYTIELLTNIQNNPSANKEDVVEAAKILLMMSTTTEVVYKSTAKENETKENQVEKL